MPVAARLTERDDEIIRALALYVRLFNQTQIRNHWFEGDAANARRRLKQLQTRGYINRVVVRARSMPSFDSPLIQWRPGQPEPEFGKAAYQCKRRWEMRPVLTCSAYIATTKAANRFGGRNRGEIKKDLQVTHDLGVAQVWLHFDLFAPEWADAWRGEDAMAATRRGQKLPDAFIVDSSATVICVVEFGGSYDEQRIRAFHEDCVARNLPYQLW